MKARRNTPGTRGAQPPRKAPGNSANRPEAENANPQKTRRTRGSTRREPGDFAAAAESPSSPEVFRVMLDKLRLSGAAILDAKGTVRYANARLWDLFRPMMRDFGGQDFTEGTNFKTCISSAYWPNVEEALKRARTQAVEGTIELLEEESGRTRTIQISFFPMPASEAAGAVIGVVANEITEMIETSEALRLSEATRQSLSTKLLQMQDEERRRMARELHDTAGQELAFTVMSLENLKSSLDQPNATVEKGLQEAADLIRKIESEIRTFSYLLHPPLLDEMGLASALRWYIDGFTKRTGIQVEVDLPGELRRLPTQHEIALFRVAQESLANVFRHSGSRKAKVSLVLNADEVRLTVEDEGRTFRRGKEGAIRAGVGIQSMRGRLEPLRGELKVEPGPQGTRVTARTPLRAAEVVGLGEPLLELTTPTRREAEPRRVTQTGRTRILIADDHRVAREGIKSLLEQETDMEVCGEATDGVEAVKKAKELEPDLIILDLTMPKAGGFSAAYQLREFKLPAKILVYTAHSFAGLERMARAAGCDGYVVKSNATHDLLKGVRAVLEGQKFFPEDAAKTQFAHR